MKKLPKISLISTVAILDDVNTKSLNDVIAIDKIRSELVDRFNKLYGNEYNVKIFTSAIQIPKDLIEKSHIHLENEYRSIWFNAKVETNEPGIYLYMLKDDEIVATRFLNFYRNIFQDSYKECVEMLKTDNYLIGNTLIVNPKYRKKGLASSILQHTNSIAHKFYKHIIGCTIEENAFRLYKTLGATFLYEEDWEEEHYWYYVF